MDTTHTDPSQLEGAWWSTSLGLPEVHQQTNIADSNLIFFKSPLVRQDFSHLNTYQSIRTGDEPFAFSRCDKTFPYLVIQRHTRVPIQDISPFLAHYVACLSLCLVA